MRINMSSNSLSSGIMSSAASSKTTKRVASVAKKTDVAAVVTPVVAAPVVAVPAEAPVKAKRAPKTVAAVAASVVDAPTVVAPATGAPVETVSAPVVVSTTWDEEIRTISGNLTNLRETASTLLGQLKRLEKNVRREMKDARKRRRRVKLDENGVEIKRAPSIFERPTQVTAELLTFLGRPAATLMSRSEVTKAVNEYVKAHELKNKHDIKPDGPLRALLAIGEGEPLTYFNLQRYLNRHYIKAVPAVAPVATA